jgi:DNA-binding LytR/AlgR family response regulator
MEQAILRIPNFTSELAQPSSHAECGSVFIRSGLRYHHVAFSDIQFVEAKKNFCNIITTRGRYMVLATMSDVEAILTAPRFCRIHRSYIVGLAHVKSFDRRTIRVCDQELPVGGTYLQALIHSRPLIGQPRSIAEPVVQD